MVARVDALADIADEAPPYASPPVGDTRELARGVGFDGKVHTDNLPAAGNTVRHFLLTNVRGQFVTLGKSDLTVFPVWNDPKRPVRAFVTDADADRSFLFVGPEKAGDRPAFFELAARPRLVEYDPKDARPEKVAGPRRAVMPYVNVLLARGQAEGEVTAV